MKRLKAKVFDHTGYGNWDSIQDTCNETLSLAGLEVEFEVVRRDFDIKWGEWDGKKHRVDYNWFAETFSKHSQGSDFAIAVYSDEQFDSGGKNSLGGQSIENNYGVSEIILRYTKRQKVDIGDDVKVLELTKRILHEMGHGLADHILGDSNKYDKVHQFDTNLRDFFRWIKQFMQTPAELTIIHHTATSLETKASTIERLHLPKYGRAFYARIITADGTIHEMHNEHNKRSKGYESWDICLTGNFTIEKPTEVQLSSLAFLLNGKPFLGHKDAGKYGATPSLCPGDLKEYYEDFIARSQKPPEPVRTPLTPEQLSILKQLLIKLLIAKRYTAVRQLLTIIKKLWN